MTPMVKFIEGAGFDWEEYSPKHDLHFEVNLEIGIGPSSDDSIELFQVSVCTPSWIETQLEGNKPRWGADRLFVHRFDRAQIEEAIKELVRRMNARTWDAFRLNLKGFLRSEYEGM